MNENLLFNLPVNNVSNCSEFNNQFKSYAFEHEPKRKRGRPLKYPHLSPKKVLDLTVVKQGVRGRPRKHALIAEDLQSHTRRRKHPSELICELGKVFYNLGWFSGTGGCISIREGENLYVPPTAMQNERLEPRDMFILNKEGRQILGPAAERGLKVSQCTPVFLLAYNMRGAGAVIHTHSKQAVLATLAYPGSEFKVTHLEMIKGIHHPTENRAMRYDEEVIVPIIENGSLDKDLLNSMAQAMQMYPNSNAVLVRRHGLFVWANTWEKAKTMTECYDYLFDMATQMTRFNLDPTKAPGDKQGNMIGGFDCQKNVVTCEPLSHSSSHSSGASSVLMSSRRGFHLPAEVQLKARTKFYT